MDARHCSKRWRPFKADHAVSAPGEGLQITSGAAAKVEDRERCRNPNVPQQRLNVLFDIVIACALPEGLGTGLVVAQRALNKLPQGFRVECHEQNASRNRHSLPVRRVAGTDYRCGKRRSPLRLVIPATLKGMSPIYLCDVFARQEFRQSATPKTTNCNERPVDSANSGRTLPNPCIRLHEIKKIGKDALAAKREALKTMAASARAPENGFSKILAALEVEATPQSCFHRMEAGGKILSGRLSQSRLGVRDGCLV